VVQVGSSPSNTVLLMPVELVELVRGARAAGGNGKIVDVDEHGRRMERALAEL
jgi:hypothetical protein